MTTTTTITPTSSPEENTSIASPTPRKRSIRCIRCSGRKFHTSKDLALHILSKHSRACVNFPDVAADSIPDDARSVTVSSSQIIEKQIAELDHLLATHEKEVKHSKIQNRTKSSQSTRKSLIKRKRISAISQRDQRKSKLRKQQLQQRQPMYIEESSSGASTETDSYSQPAYFDSQKENREHQNNGHKKNKRHTKPAKPTDGESIGPTAADILVRKCRERRVPLIPEMRPAQVLNFANALF